MTRFFAALGNDSGWAEILRCARQWQWWALQSALRTPHSALRTPHSALRTPHSAMLIVHHHHHGRFVGGRWWWWC
ncbi:MAG: hypothetical protein ACR2M0_08980 [Chloroflexia bacterium]